VSFGTRGIDLRKTPYVERVKHVGGVVNMTGKENGGDGGKKGYTYSSSCKLIYILHFVG
jgi:membrane-associated protease RseP (regulator of RpoE activity)